MSTINKEAFKKMIKECIIESLTEIDVIKVIVSEAVKAAVSTVITESVRNQPVQQQTFAAAPQQTKLNQPTKPAAKQLHLEEKAGSIGIEFSEGDVVGKINMLEVLKEDAKININRNDPNYVGEPTMKDNDDLLRKMGLL